MFFFTLADGQSGLLAQQYKEEFKQNCTCVFSGSCKFCNEQT